MSERYFTQIYNDIIRSNKFTPSEKVVLFVLMSYDNCDKIFINQKTLAKEAGVSRDTVVRALKGLRKKNMLTTEEKPDRSTLIYELNTEEVVANSDKGCSKLQQGVVANSDTSNINSSNIKLEIKKPSADKSAELAQQILDYFIEVSGVKIKVPKEPLRIIKLRLKEGYVLEDFQKVAEICTVLWKDDAKMRKHLHPTVIFNGQMDKRLRWDNAESESEIPNLEEILYADN